jgi:hypothetical protein
MTVVKNYANRVSTIATVGSTTHTLTVNDAGTIVITGTAEGDSFVLPDATKLSVGEAGYQFVNASTKSVTVTTVTPTTLGTVAADETAQYIIAAGGSVDGTWAVIAAASSSSDPSEGGTKLYNIARSAWESPREFRGRFESVSDSGGKPRFAVPGCKLANGDLITIVGGAYAGVDMAVSAADDTGFTVESLSWSATASGYYQCDLNLYNAQDQQGGLLGAVKTLHILNYPNNSGTPEIVKTNALVVGGNVLTTGGGYYRASGAGSYFSVMDLLTIVADKGLKIALAGCAQITGLLGRVDYIDLP